MTRAEFLVRHPEFSEATPALVDAKLAEAAEVIDSGVPGFEFYLSKKAAQLLALSPFGQNARMVNKEGKTTYDVHLEEYSFLASLAHRGT